MLHKNLSGVELKTCSLCLVQIGSAPFDAFTTQNNRTMLGKDGLQCAFHIPELLPVVNGFASLATVSILVEGFMNRRYVKDWRERGLGELKGEGRGRRDCTVHDHQAHLQQCNAKNKSRVVAHIRRLTVVGTGVGHTAIAELERKRHEMASAHNRHRDTRKPLFGFSSMSPFAPPHLQIFNTSPQH